MEMAPRERSRGVSLSRGGACLSGSTVEDVVHRLAVAIIAQNGPVSGQTVIIAASRCRGEPGPDPGEVEPERGPRYLAAAHGVEPGIVQQHIGQPVMEHGAEPGARGQTGPRHETAQGGGNDLVTPDGVMLARRGVD